MGDGAATVAVAFAMRNQVGGKPTFSTIPLCIIVVPWSLEPKENERNIQREPFYK